MIRFTCPRCDAALRAHAGYLLSVLGDRSGLDELVKHWREKEINEVSSGGV